MENYPNVRDFTLSKDGYEAYFTVQSRLEEVSKIVRINKINNTWSSAKLVSFSSGYKDLEPFLSPDNLLLYYVSNRPLSDSTITPKDFDIWYVKRNSIHDEWSKPINLGAPINTVNNEFYPSIANNNNLYFTSDAPGFEGKDNILVCYWIDNVYQTPISLGEAINSDGYDYNAFISPDESYLIFGSYKRPNGFGSGDLYISKRNKNGTWDKAINMGSGINSKYMDYCPFVNTVSDTIYFTSKRSDVRNQVFKSIDMLINEINNSPNGSSRLYKAPFSLDLY